MPQVIITEGAAFGLESCRNILANKNPMAALRAGQVIDNYLSLLKTEPEIGRPLESEIKL